LAKIRESIAAQGLQGFLHLQDTPKNSKNQYLSAYFAGGLSGID
jgi:hypothetical protein